MLRQIDAGHSDGADAFFTANEAEVFICGGLDANALQVDLECLGNVALHLADIRKNLGGLGNDCGIDIDQFALPLRDEPGGFPQEEVAGRSTPARVSVGKEMSDIDLAKSAEDGVANGVHQHIRVGMSVQTFCMSYVDSAEN